MYWSALGFSVFSLLLFDGIARWSGTPIPTVVWWVFGLLWGIYLVANYVLLRSRQREIEVNTVVAIRRAMRTSVGA